MKFIINKKEKSNIPSTKLYDLGTDAEIGINNLLDLSTIYIDQNTIPVLKINDSIYLINDWNSKNIKESVELLLTEDDLINLGGSGSGGGDFIPLTGTEVGSPVTGDIELLGEGNTVKFFSENTDENFRGKMSFAENYLQMLAKQLAGDNQSSFDVNPFYASLISTDGTDISSLASSILEFILTSSSSSFKGLVGSNYYGSNYDDNTYVQKKYVDERGSVFNATTSVLSASDLNTAYPNAKDGFSVIAPNVIGGGKYYIKAGAGWVYQQILAVV